ncbi:hypothetical protein [uncultured Paracoccus sp.]|jgi:hypothetical protein|uniref:hypothetical protein n=1 Tax=uncultured Paracoccus sp. TaxID=189685 RepID=UPI0030D7BC49|tara:strand:- start:10132 stop:10383 length:252 start_codon:yes stop_codon:yes gene_type:complete
MTNGIIQTIKKSLANIFLGSPPPWQTHIHPSAGNRMFCGLNIHAPTSSIKCEEEAPVHASKPELQLTEGYETPVGNHSLKHVA